MCSLLFRIWFKSQRLCTGEQTHIVGVNPTRSVHNVGQFLWSLKPDRGRCGSDSALLWLCSCLPSPCLRQQMALLTGGGGEVRWFRFDRVMLWKGTDDLDDLFSNTFLSRLMVMPLQSLAPLSFFSNLMHSLSAMSSTTSPLLLFPYQRSLTDYLPVNPTWSQWESSQICNITTQLMIQN